MIDMCVCESQLSQGLTHMPHQFQIGVWTLLGREPVDDKFEKVCVCETAHDTCGWCAYVCEPAYDPFEQRAYAWEVTFTRVGTLLAINSKSMYCA